MSIADSPVKRFPLCDILGLKHGDIVTHKSSITGDIEHYLIVDVSLIDELIERISGFPDGYLVALSLRTCGFDYQAVSQSDSWSWSLDNDKSTAYEIINEAAKTASGDDLRNLGMFANILDLN